MNRCKSCPYEKKCYKRLKNGKLALCTVSDVIKKVVDALLGVNI